MICRLCQSSEPYSLRFGDFGSRPFWCAKCRRRYRESPQTVVVPFGANRLEIESLYPGFSEDEEVKTELWMMAEKLLKKALSRPMKTTVFLWHDPLVDYAAPIWWFMLEGMGDVLVISLFEIDPLRWRKKES